MMARNDAVLIDGIIDDRIQSKRPSDSRDEAFELFAVEQVLKDADLTEEQLISGLIDGRGDGGIDAFYILVNGHILTEVEEFTWPRAGAELAVHLVSCKHHETFKQATIDAILATLAELLDFSVPEDQLSGSYSQSLLQMRRNFEIAYRRLSPRLRDFSLDIHYVSRGDSSSIGREVMARAIQVERLVSESFGSCKASFRFIGSRELVELHRKVPSYCLELQFVSQLARGERYVVLCRLSDYNRFVTDGTRLRRYLFDSNVRDFMGLTRTNEDIRETLRNTDSPDFWWLNNGVTILATTASIVGNSIQISDVQIVNGLQTTESIFRHFQAGGAPEDSRCVLVKIIVSQDVAVRDAIIRATNNQSAVELSSLHATDRIQRDIEEVFLQQGMAYERRKNFYLNQGYATEQLVTPTYLAAGSVALLLRMVHKAPALKSKFMRNQRAYELVFSSTVPLTVWPAIARILKRVDDCLEALRPVRRGTERFLKERRYLVAYLLLAKFAGGFAVTPKHILGFQIDNVTEESVGHLLEFIHNHNDDFKPFWSSRPHLLEVCRAYGEELSLEGFQSLAQAPTHFPFEETVRPVSITADFLDRVRGSLPAQPWKPGLQRMLLQNLGCSQAELSTAIETLVENGEILRQRNGVLYDLDGAIVTFDAERVDPEALQLLR
jgi:hypothetical protein